jgi:hypothetical protein
MATMQRVGKVATRVARDEKGILRVTYHSTVVVEAHPSGKIILSHGGWMTATTKTRMNQASNQYSLGFYVWQKNREWFVSFDGRDLPFDHSTIVLSRK